MLLDNLTSSAIIFIPALILIPIAKIVALFIAGFSLPAIGASALIAKLFNTKAKKVIFMTIITLLVLAVILALSLKLQNPDRPWI